MQAQIAAWTKKEECANFIKDLLKRANDATKKSPWSTDIDYLFTQTEFFIGGKKDTSGELYASPGSYDRNHATIFLTPFLGTNFDQRFFRLGDVDYAKQALHELLHLTGGGQYSDMVFANAVGDMGLGVGRPPERTNFKKGTEGFQRFVYASGDYWVKALANACFK